MLKKLFHFITVIAVMLIIFSCASTKHINPPNNKKGFLPNYSLLKPLPNNTENIQNYVYKNPKIKNGSYYAVILEPVDLYQPKDESSAPKIRPQMVETAREIIKNKIKETISKNYNIVNTTGDGVARINVAITGAIVEPDGFHIWNIIPISAVIKLAAMATGLDGKTPVLIIETKVTDSKTGNLLRATVSVINGKTFRLEASTPEEFTQLAEAWIMRAMQYMQNN